MVVGVQIRKRSIESLIHALHPIDTVLVMGIIYASWRMCHRAPGTGNGSAGRFDARAGAGILQAMSIAAGAQQPMRHTQSEGQGRGRSLLIGGVAVVYFIAALEIVIMISPFAFFFYAVFNPILLGLNQSAATRWLTAFFLPHMVAPTTPLLIAVRVLGSVFFIGGSLIFLVCAAQVYLGKLLKWGVAERGLYALMRHPQYSGLTLAGLGLTILWPRFLTLMFLAVMVFLYYLLARDEERRMLRHYGEAYQTYLERTGMFWPRLSRKPAAVKPLRWQAAFLLLIALTAGAAALGFGLRAYTVARLPLATVGGIDLVSIIPGDLPTAKELLQGIRDDPVAAARLRSIQTSGHSRILAYAMPVDYVMQGMIANTGPEWKLFRHHQTFAMIVNYIFHPIAHLQGGHMHHAMAMPMQHGPAMYNSPMMRRRIVFLEVRANHALTSARDDFAINNQRIPRFFADVHLHTDEVLQVRETPHGTGWGTVPTPMF
jgi:protein-S-isoprenylcysteine O-methyltransferase Ste14